MFSTDSAVVKSWVSLIKAGIYKLEQVPALFNLREAVSQVISAE